MFIINSTWNGRVSWIRIILVCIMFFTFFFSLTNNIAKAQDAYISPDGGACRWERHGESLQCTVNHNGSPTPANCFTMCTICSYPNCSTNTVRTGDGTIYPRSSCQGSLLWHANMYRNTCSGQVFCDNAAITSWPRPQCHYWVPTAWGSCQPTGVQYATAGEWRTKTFNRGDTCAHESSTRSCTFPNMTNFGASTACGVPNNPLITTTWNHAPGFVVSRDVYQMFRCLGSTCTVSTASGSTNLVASITGTSWTDADVVSGTTYRYAGRTRFNGLWSLLTPYRTVTAPSCSTPVNGSCGTRNTTYPSTETAWPGGSTYCSSGSNTTSPSFPSVGGTVNWTCAGSGGGSNASCSASRTAPLPNVTLYASPTYVSSGSGATLQWNSLHADTCIASRSPSGGTWTGSKGAVSGQNYTEPTGALTAPSYTFNLECTGPGGTTVATPVTIQVSDLKPQ